MLSDLTGLHSVTLNSNDHLLKIPRQSGDIRETALFSVCACAWAFEVEKGRKHFRYFRHSLFTYEAAHALQKYGFSTGTYGKTNSGISPI